MDNIDVYPNPQYPAAKIICGDQEFPAVIGSGGAIDPNDKQEGDLRTPFGMYKILAGLYRSDRLGKPVSAIDFIPISESDIWIDDPSSPSYNTLVSLDNPEGINHERLWRDDDLYNLILDLDYNRAKPIPGKGSGIFVHVARNQEDPASTPTEGCVALSQDNLLSLVAKLTNSASVTIHE